MKKNGFNFSHIGIYANDLAAMELFYTNVLKFTVTDRGDLEGPNGPMTLTFMSRDPDEHHQIVLISGRPKNLEFNVINQISLRGDNLTSLRTMLKKLKEVEAKNIDPVTHGNSLSIYVHDPEGNRIELYINMPWYVNQPMRVPVDMSVDDETLMSTLEKHARSLPGFRPREEWRAEMAKKMGLTN